MEQCNKPDADAFLAPSIALAPPAAVALPGPAPSDSVVSDEAIAKPAPSPEILDPPPRG